MVKKHRFYCFLFLFFFIFISDKLQAGKERLSNGVLWVSTSDEYKLCVYQSYEDAAESLKEILEEKKPDNWCVVMDIDDTILSTVNHIISLEEKGEDYSDKEWMEWYKKDEAEPLPGAVEFTETVKKLGGKVILITNTQAQLKEITLNKLKTFNIKYDICLMREGPYEKDKNKLLRIKDVEEGTIKGLNIPPLNIIMRIGDSAHDLYDITKYKFEDVKDRTGKDLIIIPNPMYGTWSHVHDMPVENTDTPLKTQEGKEFTIKLPSNPSTGYKWTLQEMDEKMFTLMSHKYEKKDNLLPGSGGNEIWIFKALKKGKSIISFTYIREWEKSEKLREEKSFFILVK